uniref:Reverse transcriptase domain-containing protein n=1 Tax=Trichobilharzia regenti TaxID=157069 RepID=A0AA85J846_TRIRE|nr:unnamed protein product [Trichobilharzia regenti]
MGSSLGPLLADCFMSSLENNPLSPTIDDFQLYKRYIDDTFIICDENCDLKNLLQIFNNAHPNIDFTLETESDEMFHFLDVHLTRNVNNSLKRSIYKKPTWNGQFINFQSFVPLSRKRNLIYTLSSRIRKICSEEMIEELRNLRKTLMENRFSPRFIDKNLKCKKTSEQVQSVPKKILLLNLEFKGDIEAEILRKRLSKSLRKTYFAASLRLTFSCKKLFSQNAKDKLSHWATSTCIYQFTSSCGAEYIGRTMRRLEKTRL